LDDSSDTEAVEGQAGRSVVVAVGGSTDSRHLVEAARLLARTLRVPWHAVHVEIPDGREESGQSEAVADALALAARYGAAIATVPAATVADGIAAHLENVPAAHLVLGRSRSRPVRLFGGKSIEESVGDRHPGIALHLLPPSADALVGAAPASVPPSPLRHYVYAAAMVAVTVAIAALLQRATHARGLDLLFLFPAIVVAARLGLRPALLAVLLSVGSYNFFLLRPAFSLDLRAPENLIVLPVLLAVSIYVSLLTTRLRGRLALADRSAQENASLAAFALRLTRVAEWETTAQAVCEQVATMLNVQTVLLREISGKLEIVAGVPAIPELGALDNLACEWAWEHGEEAGKATSNLALAEWQFRPLATSLGVLAILGLARENGDDPIRAHQAVLLSTLLAQAALAHERLRLEDLMRLAGSAAHGSDPGGEDGNVGAGSDPQDPTGVACK
jgi:K+-sensing histidine kinase KdpD